MTRPQQLVLLGHPVSHSLSPAIQNAALRAAGIEMEYRAIDVAPQLLETTLADLANRECGGNITVPHKQRAMECMASHTPLAHAVGAVNCFRPDGNGSLVGHNTDVAGFVALARRTRAVRDGVTVALIGSGGSAAAVLAAISGWSNARARIYARNRSTAEKLAARFSDVAGVADEGPNAKVVGDVVVNATPVGLADDSFPVELDRLDPNALVLDLAYKTGETAWVRAARDKGHRAADGITMLVEQAAAAFAWWFGMEPDRDAMWAALGRRSPD